MTFRSQRPPGDKASGEVNLGSQDVSPSPIQGHSPLRPLSSCSSSVSKYTKARQGTQCVFRKVAPGWLQWGGPEKTHFHECFMQSLHRLLCFISLWSVMFASCLLRDTNLHGMCFPPLPSWVIIGGVTLTVESCVSLGSVTEKLGFLATFSPHTFYR